MGPEIISYIALGFIIVIGFFIVRAAFKLHEKNYPLEDGEKKLYEESDVRFETHLNGETTIRKVRVRITDRRLFIFSHREYLYAVIYVDGRAADKTRDHLKGVEHIPRTSFKVEHHEKRNVDVLVVEHANIIGLPMRYTFFMAGVQDAAKALGIV